MKFNRFPAVVLFGICTMPLPMTALAYDTLAVSEEDPPATCHIGDAIVAATCYGSNCDNIKLSCADTNYTVYQRSWSTNFSEEGTNYRFCGQNQIMTGISCAGSNCDNVSIECSSIPRAGSLCQWIGPFSEEQGYVDFGGRYAAGMQCIGSRCDAHRYYVCHFLQ